MIVISLKNQSSGKRSAQAIPWIRPLQLVVDWDAIHLHIVVYPSERLHKGSNEIVLTMKSVQKTAWFDGGQSKFMTANDFMTLFGSSRVSEEIESQQTLATPALERLLSYPSFSVGRDPTKVTCPIVNLSKLYLFGLAPRVTLILLNLEIGNRR